MSVEKFDLKVVSNNFNKSLVNDDDIYLDEYLEGFKELYKFFHLMGSVFSFVSSDVKVKIEILEDFRKKESAENFLTFKTMLEYEKTSGLLKKSDYVSGSRTLLRLHRGLDFIREFLEQIGKISADEKSYTVCKNAYNGTLAKYHPWLVRKGATIAMAMLPTRDQLLTKVCVDVEQAILTLPDMLSLSKNVFDRTENLYTVFELHELP